ncbi:hypothetical protein J2X47_001966 [Sphingomonas sp. BE270]|jgi:hypothetical protein|uniref:hypothetical protein n=1 Tax=Sphingomonas sp. BE270 TaxID=2817726 RepID=UPI00286739CF|nr:hypothetical protein [Sphingomonas sp. BE270]MDR7257786.1 hypothetical protein [Sphingomonas sp. BE270]
MTLHCPSCGSDSTQKLSLFVRSGTFSAQSDTIGAGAGGGHLGLAIASTKTKTSSHAAKEHAEPIAQPVLGPLAGVAFIALMIWIFWAAIPAAVLIGLGALGAASILHDNLTKLPQRHRDWMQKFICLRCATVFEPKP